MTRSIYKIECIGIVFLVSVILFSSLYVKTPIEIAFSQTSALSTSFQVEESTYHAIPSPGDTQNKNYESLPKDHTLKSTSAISNPLSYNPGYSVTNATISIERSVLDGINSNKAILDNQTIIIPKENFIVAGVQ